MAETKWTPGPWEIEECGDDELEICCDLRIQRALVPIAVLQVGYDGPMEVEQQANAHLIAAAPELYEALEELLAMQDQMARRPSSGGGVLPADYGITRGKAHTALAKARGEKEPA